MAEGLFRKFGGDNIEVFSAGLEPQRVNPYGITVMKEIGVDISGYKSKHVNTFVGGPFDNVITVCDNAAAHCPAFPGEGARLHWPFQDPVAAAGTQEELLDNSRKVRDRIGERILQRLMKLKDRGEVG